MTAGEGSAEEGDATRPPKRIYLANDDHTDYLWSGDEAQYDEAFGTMIDYYLDLADQTDHLPADHQSRFNCDSTIWLDAYRRTRPAAQLERLLGRIRSGHISFAMNYLVSTYGATPLEAVIRTLSPSAEWQREHAISSRLVLAMENQTLPLGIATIFSGAGARWSWRGICNCATQVGNAFARRPELFWWTGVDDRRILMKWYAQYPGHAVGAHHPSMGLGGYAEARFPAETIEHICTSAQFLLRHPERVLGAFGYGWDDLATTTSVFVETAISHSTESRRIIVSNERDFFEDVESSVPDLPSVGMAHGNDWDLAASTIARATTAVRNAVERLRSAEFLAALAHPSVWDALRAERRRFHRDLGMFWEHNMVGGGPAVSNEARADWQFALAARISAFVGELVERSVRDLAGAADDRVELVVANPLGHRRTDLVTARLDPSIDVLAVLDLDSGLAVPHHVAEVAGERHVSFLAVDVPGWGRRRYRIVGDPAPGRGDDPPLRTRIVVDPVDGSLSALGADSLLLENLAVNRLFGAHDAVLDVTVEDRVTERVTTVTRRGSTTVYRQIRGLTRVDIENIIHSPNPSDVLGWEFDFRFTGSECWHEEIGAVLRAAHVDEGGHYARANHRVDFLSAQHFVALQTRDASVVVSNQDCSFFALGESTREALDSGSSRVRFVSSGPLDTGHQLRPRTSVPLSQRFSISVTPAAEFDAARAMTHALEHQNPLIPIIRPPDRPWNVFAGTELSIPDDVVAWAAKPHDDGHAEGAVVRLWNLGPFARTVSIDGEREWSHLLHTESDPVPIVAREWSIPARGISTVRAVNRLPAADVVTGQ